MLNENGLYVFEDISFVNTREFSRTAQHFSKFGKYIDAPENSREYQEFWDIEEDRILNGMSLPGKLIEKNGIFSMQNVHITGEHYGYLNYGRIKKTDTKGLIDEAIKQSSQQKNGKGKALRKSVNFADFWDGDYHYYKAKEYAKSVGLHMTVSKSRRKGFSFKEGNDVGLTANFNPESVSIVGAYDFKYIKGQGQIMDMAIRNLDFIQEYTDFGRGYLNRNRDVIKLGYINEGDSQRIERGYLSSIIALSFKDNPKAAIGKDGINVKLEEAGDFPNLIPSVIELLPTLMDGEITTGFLTIFGATTDDVGNFEAFKEIFYNPAKFNMLAFEDVWENSGREKGICYFFPNSQNYSPYIDEHGNSNIIRAKEAIKETRAKNQENLSVSEYQIYLSKYCETPSEAFFTSGGSVLSSPQLLLHIQDLESDPNQKHIHRSGILSKDSNGKIKFNFENPITGEIPKPILNHPMDKSDDPTGCIIEWETPYKDKDGIIPDDLYIIVVDPYATNKEKGTISLRNSLGAAYVYKVANNFTGDMGDILVASYVGRELDTEDYSRNLFLLSERWNAKIQFENDRGTIYQDAKLLGYMDMLFDEPEFNFAKEISGKTGRGKGTHINASRIAKAVGYLYTWLHEKIGGVHTNGEPRLRLHTIKDLALLKQIVNWCMDGNFDRVSAMFILMFQIKELLLIEVETARYANVENDSYFDNFEMFN